MLWNKAANSRTDEPDPRPAASTGGMWAPEQAHAARRAIGALTGLYPESIARDGRIPAEPLFCIVGALAGFAAHFALRQEPATANDAIAGARAPGGEPLADRIAALLVPERADGLSAFSIVGGQALRLGAARTDLPDCRAIVAHAAAPDFGAPRLPAGQPLALQPRTAVEIFWPATLTAFAPAAATPDFTPLAPQSWPLALALIAATYMDSLRTVFSPALAAQIFMEAAIPMSRIDQDAICFVRDTRH